MPLVEKALSKESVSKSLNLILLAYGTDLAAAHRYVGTLHSDVHKLVRKMQHNSVG